MAFFFLFFFFWLVCLLQECRLSSVNMLYKRGQHFSVDSVSSISNALHLKLTSNMILQELYSIEKGAICLDTFLRF